MRSSKISQYLLQKKLCLILIILLCAVHFSIALEDITGSFIINKDKSATDKETLNVKDKENTEPLLITHNKSKTNEKDTVSPITGFTILDSSQNYEFLAIIKAYFRHLFDFFIK